MRAITLDEAVKIINETFAEAKRRNAYPLTAVLLDAGGRMKAALKQDGASLLRFEVSYGKAYAALAMGRESRQVLQKAKDKPLFMQSFLELADGPMFLEGGGQLIRDQDGEVVGAIATTGDTNEVDDLCAIAGIQQHRGQRISVAAFGLGEGFVDNLDGFVERNRAHGTSPWPSGRLCGAGRGNRTPDLRFTKPLLYR